jgi:hypothetical protein
MVARYRPRVVDQSRADLMLRLGLLSLVVPILGPFVWLSASRALGADNRESRTAAQTSRLVWGRRLGVAASVILVSFLAVGLVGGQAVEAPR